MGSSIKVDLFSKPLRIPLVSTGMELNESGQRIKTRSRNLAAGRHRIRYTSFRLYSSLVSAAAHIHSRFYIRFFLLLLLPSSHLPFVFLRLRDGERRYRPTDRDKYSPRGSTPPLPRHSGFRFKTSTDSELKMCF